MLIHEAANGKPSFYTSNLGRKLILSLVLISTVITIVITTVQLYLDYRSDIDSIEEQYRLMDKVHLPPLSESLWSSDMDEVRIHLEGMSHIRDIQYVAIKVQGVTKVAVGDRRDANVVQRNFPVEYVYRGNTQKIGELIVAFSLSGVYQRLLDKVVVVLIGNGIKTFIVAILVMLIFHRLITRYIHQIATYAAALDLGHIGQDLVLERKDHGADKKDELDLLVDSINHMRLRLNDSLQALHESTKSYRSLIESSYSIPWEMDLKTWRFTYIGPQAEGILGHPVKDWYQPSFWQDHIYPDDREKAVKSCFNSTEHGLDHEFEYRFLAADGRVVWIRDSVSVVCEGDRPVRLQGFMFDITRQKHAQEILRQTEDKFSKVFHSSPVAILISREVDGRIIDFNQSFEELFGYELDQVKGKTTRELGLWLSDEDRNKMIELLRREGSVEHESCALLDRNGEYIQCQIAVHSIELDSEVCLITVLQDITERSRVESSIQALAKSSAVLDYKEFIRHAVRNLALAYQSRYAFIGILLPNQQQVRTLAVWADGDFAENFTYKLEGTPCQDIFDEKLELVPSNAWRLYPNDKMLKDMAVEAYMGSPLMSSEKKILGLVSVMHDQPMRMQKWVEPILTLFATRIAAEVERQVVMEELEEHRHNLEQLVAERTSRMELLNQELESFCYSVSHDLRAPLRSINGFTRALLEDYSTVIDEQGVDYLSRVYRGANRMSDLIDALLEISRITRTEPVNETIDLSALADEILDDLKAHEPARQVSVHIQPGLAVVSDKRFMKIIMANLLENAWKYTSRNDQAKIEVGTVKIEAEDVFYVRDNGVGFDVRYAAKMFEAFQRLHLTDEFEGTGIGLATVHKVIQQSGGRIWADATPGKGATFYFVLAVEKMTSQYIMHEC